MEKYAFDNMNDYTIKIDGKYVLKISEKHKIAYGENGAQNIFNNAIEMFEKSFAKKSPSITPEALQSYANFRASVDAI